MQLRILCALLAAFSFAWAAEDAHAGVIKHLGRMIKGGSQHAATATTKASGAAVGGVESAGKATTGVVETGVSATKTGTQAAVGGVAAAGTATGSAVKNGAVATKSGTVAVVHGAEQTPRVAAHGTKAVAKKILHAIY